MRVLGTVAIFEFFYNDAVSICSGVEGFLAQALPQQL